MAMAEQNNYLHYSRAIVGTVCQSYAEKALRFVEPLEPIHTVKAISQHKYYVSQLEKILGIGNVLQITGDDNYPDQVFVDDPAVAAAGKAVLTKVKPESRKGEREAMKKALDALGVPYSEMVDHEAVLDGGDVLFTGKEFLIGLSTRTNAVRLI